MLSFDPGATRMGFALLESGPKYLDSGIIGLSRDNDEKYHAYRLRLIHFWANQSAKMFRKMKPDVVVSEIVPIKGFSDPSQAYLAGAAINTVHAIASIKKIENHVVSAASVKVAVAKHKATKAQVRDGVINLLPALEARRKGWTKIFDEPDAIAIGLCFMKDNDE